MQDDNLFTFDKWQNSFINEKKLLNKSNNTIINYSNVLDRLYDYYSKFEDSIDFFDIDREFILSFLSFHQNYSPNYLNLHLTVIKNFFKYIDSHNKDGRHFDERFNNLTVKATKTTPKHLDEREYNILINHLNAPIKKKSFLQYRNRLLTKIIIYTGIRSAECLAIKLDDFQFIKENTIFKIHIHGKGDKERYVYIPIEIIESEYNYFNEYFKGSNIAITGKRRVMARQELYSMLKTLFKRLSIMKTGIHILRHTFGRNMVKKQINLSVIKELLGHSNIQTTMIYAQTDEESMIDAIS